MGLRTLCRKWFGIDQRRIKENKIKENERLLKEWEMSGKPVPPPHIVKQNAVSFYRDKYRLKQFVETGTFLGDMVEAQRNNFNSVVSIELDVDLYNKAVERFKKNKNVKIHNGDSGEVLVKIMKDIGIPCLFWLDGHYSAGITAKGDLVTPINKELKCILSTDVNHVVLIDDARLFVGEDDYPTLEELRATVKSISVDYNMEVKDDIIRLHK